MRILKNTLVLSFSLILSFLPYSAIGQQNVSNGKTGNQGRLSFFITDSENGYGVPAKLSLKGPHKTFELSTNEGGKLEFKGEPGRYDITIFGENYDVLSTYFNIESGKTLNIEAILEKSDRIPVQFENHSSATVEGYVVNPKTGKPLSGVRVQLLEEGLVVTTNSDGFFSLKPSRFAAINSPDDIVIRSNFKFSKNGFTSHIVEKLLMVPDKIKLKVYLEEGQGENIEKYHQKILDGTEKDVEMYENTAPKEDANNNKSSLNRSSCSVPTSIRVGTSCSCTNCSSVAVMSLQYYSESGLDNEWISSWNSNSLKAGSIPYRTYGGYYVNNPVKPNFDIASSTCNQVWGSQVYSNTQSAAQSTSGQILTSNGTSPARSEYSAENNRGGSLSSSPYNCSNGYAGGSGAYSCYSDNICSGKTPAGHGRGMCQWGSQRWALNGKSHTWIINHYFISRVNYTLCSPPIPPTNLSVSQSPDCNNGAILTWTNSANNWTIQISTSSNFSNSSSKTVSSGTSTTAPSGFSPSINWQPFTTYYWRINYGSGIKTGSTFTYDQCDITSPTTSVSIPSGWKTDDFTVQFTDADETGGSGLAKSFYQVLYFNGSAWKANPNRGFFGDNFDGTSIDPIWTTQTGTWSISSNNKLKQANTSEGNSNIYASLTQNLSNRYLYVWNGKISGTDQNKRAGFHFFCDNAAQTERGNSYLVYFRAGGNSDPNNNNKVQIYKASGNTLTLIKNVSRTINPDQWYEYGVAFDRITGQMHVYVNGQVVTTWTDPSPHSNGNAVSFRNGNCSYEVDNFKVYRTRYPNVTVTVGPGTNTDIPFQNPNPSTPSAKVKSIVMDNAGNLSTIAQELVNVDWTKPQNLTINDGASTDIDTNYTTTLEGNWGTANDPHSGIVEYKVAIGTTPGNDDVVGWNSNGTNSTLSNTLTGLIFDQVYYISVSAENGAGLVDTTSSDGQRYVEEISLSIKEDVLKGIEMYPNPTVKQLHFKNLDSEADILIYDMAGQLVLKTKVNSNVNKVDVSGFAQGSYNVMIKMGEQFVVKKLIKK
ncbi:MAG TPA: T9SS type A sorting domain-containing protein [Brumimicrobium sp.]|nr:T9SS type A sorting domain-containing protein [Brumimicrobium sp.]